MDCVKRGRWWFNLIECPICKKERYIRRDVFNKRGNVNCASCRRKKHGMAINKYNKKDESNWLYVRWQRMKARCKTKDTYKNRGITVHLEWCDDFLSFYDWAIANGANPELELDRIDNNLGYTPDNCRWVTHRENCRPGGRSGKFEVKENNNTQKNK